MPVWLSGKPASANKVSYSRRNTSNSVNPAMGWLRRSASSAANAACISGLAMMMNSSNWSRTMSKRCPECWMTASISSRVVGFTEDEDADLSNPPPWGNAVELRSRSASLCRLGTRFVLAAKGCRPTIWFVSVLNSTVLEPAPPAPLPRLAWVEGKSGVCEIGHNGDGFAYDNEGPRHATWLQPHALASRPIVNGEYLEFINEGGYGCPELWLSLGWDTVRANQWEAPLYWVKVAGDWWHFTLAGLRPLDINAPVCHVSYFEAEAYARWAGARLPTEAEWETAASAYPLEGHFVESGRHQPLPPTPLAGKAPLLQLFGDVWEWTSSPYSPYPGFSPAAGAVGEYNGKFMCNQFVLRGGSCATPQDHIRHTYRNFFQPEARWQFSGFRLAR